MRAFEEEMIGNNLIGLILVDDVCGSRNSKVTMALGFSDWKDLREKREKKMKQMKVIEENTWLWFGSDSSFIQRMLLLSSLG